MKDIIRMNQLAGIITEGQARKMMEVLGEDMGLTPLQQYVYNYEENISGEDGAERFLNDIKKLDTPQDVYDYYSYKRGWEGSDLNNIFKQVKRKFASLNKADELTPDQKQWYSYVKGRFGFEEAKKNLELIKTFKDRDDFMNWLNNKIKEENEIFKQSRLNEN
jgi:hypothetical protein